MQTNVDKRKQTQRRNTQITQANPSKRRQTQTNANKRKQTLSLPHYCGFLHPPSAIPLVLKNLVQKMFALILGAGPHANVLFCFLCLCYNIPSISSLSSFSWQCHDDDVKNRVIKHTLFFFPVVLFPLSPPLSPIPSLSISPSLLSLSAPPLLSPLPLPSPSLLLSLPLPSLSPLPSPLPRMMLIIMIYVSRGLIFGHFLGDPREPGQLKP